MGKALTELNIIKSDIDTAPEGAEWRGEFVEWGGKQRKVFVEKVQRSKIVPVKDPLTGGPMYKRGAGGIVLNRVMTERVVDGEEEREFILVDQGNGIVRKQYKFRTSPDEIAEREKQARKARFLEELFERAEEAGGLDALLAIEEDDE